MELPNAPKGSMILQSIIGTGHAMGVRFLFPKFTNNSELHPFSLTANVVKWKKQLRGESNGKMCDLLRGGI